MAASDRLETVSGHREHINRDLPLALHTNVLGVDIVGHQQAEAALMAGVKPPGGLDAEPQLETWQGERYDRKLRADLAAWARRNLFDGVKPGGADDHH